MPKHVVAISLMKVLLDQFPVAIGKLVEIIQDKTNEILKDLFKFQKKNAMIGTSVSAEEIEKSTGLITEHAYQIY